MFAAERKKRIKRYLIENKQADVIELSNLLDVSKVTIRRDLDELEVEKFIIRTHGGAMINEEDSVPLKIIDNNHDKHDNFVREKQIIGRIASLIVKDNSSIMLCPGNTCEYIAGEIKDKQNLRIVTTDINVLSSLVSDVKNRTLSVMLPGGEIDLVSMQLSGSITENMIEGMFFDYAFVEVDGVDIERGYSVENFSKASIIKKVMKLSRQVIAVCDHEKFEAQSFFHIGNIDTFNKVISTEHVSEKYKKYFFSHNIQLLTTFDVY